MPIVDLNAKAEGLAGRRILVTGADGFIGSHLVESLAAAGCDVRAFVQYNSFNSWGWLDGVDPALKAAIDVVPGDIRDQERVRAAVKDRDIVLHLAALIAIPYSYLSSEAYIDTNVRGTLNVLLAARDQGVDRLVVTSTSEVYGTARAVPITEQHPLQAQSPYAATKIAADALAISFHASFGMPVVILRPFNTYGPRQSARAVIPTIITQIADGRRSIRLGSLHPTRDFSFVADTVRGFARAAVAPGILGEVLNIGSDFEISIGELARLISELMDTPIEIETGSERVRPANSEVDRLWAGTAKARELMGWEPLYGGRDGLRRGLEATITWFKDPANRKRYAPNQYSI